MIFRDGLCAWISLRPLAYLLLYEKLPSGKSAGMQGQVMEPLEVAEAHRELLERAQEIAQQIAERVSKVLPSGVSTSDPTPLQTPALPPNPPEPGDV